MAPSLVTASGRLPAVIAAVPIKSFSAAKARLGDAVPAGRRADLGIALAARTAGAARDAGARVLIVSGATEVLEWARTAGFGRVGQENSGLDDAAAIAVAVARRERLPWAIIHADLPLVRVSDLQEVFAAAAAGPVLAPSVDGGTNVIAADAAGFAFAYGPGSFARHLRTAASRRPRIVVRPGTAVDLDTARDLKRVMSHPEGRWVNEYLD